MRKLAWMLGAALSLVSPHAEAFCGFYVGGGSSNIFNNATQVVLMREGTRTVLSMQNNYQGPPENFAMVVPVPVILQKENVKTLDQNVFDKIDQLGAPRLVEYWEQDPCPQPVKYYDYPKSEMMMKVPSAPTGAAPEKKYGVTVEAQFTVGEYEIVILSAKESTGLNDWLVDNKYNIPKGAAAVLKPYIEGGLKFFVAKVNINKVSLNADGQAMLSPLRFHYDTETFFLPVRLGLLNSNGTQDMIVNVFAKDRYEVANYKNVTIPTNFDVVDAVRDEFGPWYAALFDKTLEKNPGAVVTEYAWSTSFSSSSGNASCDPCPASPPGQKEILSLGADVLPSTKKEDMNIAKGVGLMSVYQIETKVLTRLHLRYGKETLGEDLVFAKADPIVGGREHNAKDGKLENGSSKGTENFFQARYAIRHPWTGPIKCKNPVRGVWGGPPAGTASSPMKSAKDLAFAPRGSIDLPKSVYKDIPEIDVKVKAKTEKKKKKKKAKKSAELLPSYIEEKSAPWSNTQAPLAIGGLFFGGVLIYSRNRKKNDVTK
jgi:hypothetical protein